MARSGGAFSTLQDARIVQFDTAFAYFARPMQGLETQRLRFTSVIVMPCHHVADLKW